MQGIFRITVSLIVLCISVLSNANEKRNFEYEAYLKTGFYSVNEEAGNSDTAVAVVPGIKANYNLAERGQRVYSGFEYYSFKLDASSSNIGQEVKGFSFLAGYEHRFNISRQFKLWLGGGLSLNQSKFKNRQIVSGGFLDQAFEDRDETYIGASFTANTYFQLSPNSPYSLGVGAFYDLSNSNGIEAFGIKLTFQLSD